jgi:endoglucanase
VVTPPLSTKENRIIDSMGKQIRFAGVNWYGAHMKRHVVNGLDKRSISEIAGHIASLGFNCVRLPFSNEMYWDNPSVAADTVGANPQFAGRPAMEVYDAVVAELTRKGIMVILNDHNSDAQWCCSEEDGNGLWYTNKYPVERWRKMWVELVRRYRTNPLVVGADLRNELRKANGKWPSWGKRPQRNVAMPSSVKIATC